MNKEKLCDACKSRLDYQKVYQKAYREANRERLNDIQREKRKNNPDKLKGYNKKYREKHREEVLFYSKEHYKANKEYHRTKQKAYYKANKEKINAHNKEYREKNKEKVKIHAKKYRENNRGIFRAIQAKRRARILQATPAWANLQQIKNIYTQCPNGYHVDHVVPLRGKNVCGFHVENNLQYLKPRENVQKGNKYNNE